ncbi:Delta(3,5)-Delta(2,4)-dienoyl-CoA isomerase, mitochondrial [Armadillidium nasatum]|uniref:Delta(3,5)-Delta(2,4)-dienoyl-CoA isomerase, mitochondrial n=1 Tax=Armadillidium nasatum TaxID=96803 RepID=A0A5N5TFA6_9CRUS|nr:Delta(3,5)-Delta(2,4)-dienoyl-CoA isomerase, mitochondrial [Armadillidium nasatum]
MFRISSVGKHTYRFYILGQNSLVGNIAKCESIRRQSTSADNLANYPYKSLIVSSPKKHVFHVEINRPEKLNAFNKVLWREMGECFAQLGEDSLCRAVVLSGQGKLFTAGIDLTDLTELGSVVTSDDDIAKKCRTLFKTITHYQNSLSSLEECPKPVIAAVHGACIGAGIDLISAADVRYCTSDAWFQIKEVELGLAADVGTLQRFPKTIGSSSVARELCFTARKFLSDEAVKIGFISRVFPDKAGLVKSALELAETIAKKSPVAMQTTKETLNYSRDHTVEEGLKFIAGRNMAFLQSADLMKAAMAMMNKESAEFSDY